MYKENILNNNNNQKNNQNININNNKNKKNNNNKNINKVKGKFFVGFLCLLFLVIFTPVISLAFGPSSSTIYQGIDVSSYQGNINFSLVKNAGIDIVYIKSSEGRSYIDPYFERNYQNAKANGLKVGFYHYVTARTTEQAREQANFFARVISGKEPDCRLAMDFESFGNLSVIQINEISKVFLETLQSATGKDVLIYSNSYSARTIFSRELAIYPLWVANYGVSEPGGNDKWSTWVGWQYTSTGRVSGILGNVDRDQFTDGVLLSNTSPIPTPETPTTPEAPENSETIVYTVKSGDTLSEIARDYGTTVNSIVSLNTFITNPNLIYPGQQLTIRTNSLTNNNVNNSNSSSTVYTVVRGDTLSEIATKYNTTVSNLVTLNNISNPNLIYPGQRIIISNGINSNLGNECGKILYTVKRGDTLSGIAAKYDTTVSEIATLNNISNPNLIYAGSIIRVPNCKK